MIEIDIILSSTSQVTSSSRQYGNKRTSLKCKWFKVNKPELDTMANKTKRQRKKDVVSAGLQPSIDSTLAKELKTRLRNIL
jgi:response regulator of citrate/malate metabolism